MNREAIQYHFDENGIDYREFDTGFLIREDALSPDTLGELAACNATLTLNSSGVVGEHRVHDGT